jgi:hypothetical protein
MLSSLPLELRTNATSSVGHASNEGLKDCKRRHAGYHEELKYDLFMVTATVTAKDSDDEA